MPDLLGATNPIPGYDKAVTNRNVQVTPQQNPQLQNIPDLTKVVRADGRTEQQSADLQGQKQVRYDSNFQTFVQRLMQAPNLMDSLMSIFFRQRGYCGAVRSAAGCCGRNGQNYGNGQNGRGTAG